MSGSVKTSLLIFSGALIFFVPFLGSVHLFDWDEINFAEAAREMLLTGEYAHVQIGFQPFWEKPPLFIWLQALFMSIFGISEFAARLPNAIAGAISLMLLYRIGLKWYDHRFGLLWAGVYAASFLPQFYFRSGIIDPWFNLFIFLGIERLVVASNTSHIRSVPVFWAGVFIGLAVLTKGPAALVLAGTCALVYLLVKWKTTRFKLYQPFLFLLPVLLIGFSWFIYEALVGNWETVQAFIDYNIRLITESEAGHGQPFYYHAVVLILGCFPMSLLFLFGLKRLNREKLGKLNHHRLWMIILFWVVFIIFSAVRTKIIHYSSLTYFPMSFIAATVVYGWLQHSQKPKSWQLSVLFLQSAIIGVAIVLAGLFPFIAPLLLESDLIHDPMVISTLSIEANWQSWESFIGLILITGTAVGVVRLKKRSAKTGIGVLLISSFFTVWLAALAIMPRVEEYTQGGLIRFYQEKTKNSDAYFEPLLYRSYAHLYYGERTPDQHPKAHGKKWLLNGKVDRPVYFVTRTTRMDDIRKYHPTLVVIGNWTGYTFLTRGDENYPFLDTAED